MACCVVANCMACGGRSSTPPDGELDIFDASTTAEQDGHADDGSNADGSDPTDGNACRISGGSPDVTCGAGSICYANGCNEPPICASLTGLCSAFASIGTVCGCDGNIYAKPCDAFSRGVMLAPAERCGMLADRFACGFEFCDPAAQYCEHAVNGASLGFRQCRPLPRRCLSNATPDCACISDLLAMSCSACRYVPGPVPYLELDCNGVAVGR